MSKLFCCLFSLLFSVHVQCLAQRDSHWTLDDLVNDATLGKTQKYVEFKIGSPAMREYADQSGITHSQYEIGKCLAWVAYKKRQVVSVSMYVSANCDLDVSKLFSVPGAKLSQTTIENWTHRQHQLPHFVDPIRDHRCNSCGEDPGAVLAIFSPNSANGFVATVLTGEDDSRLREIWQEKLHQAGVDGQQLYDKHYKSSTGDCPQEQFDDFALPLLSAVKVSGIEIRQSGGPCE